MEKRYWNLPVLITGIILLSACGSTHPPTKELTETRMIIHQAEQIGANDYAPLEIREARIKLERAQAAVEEKNFEKARRLAEHARVDAEYAQIKTLSGKSQKAVKELKESIRLLEEEIAARNFRNQQ